MARFIDRLALAVSTLIALASTASAAINEWTSVGPEGGDITDLVITNTTPAMVYATTQAGLYRSTDMGQTWSLAVGRAFRHTSDLAVHPTDLNRVALAAEGHVLITRDGNVPLYRLTPPTASIPIHRVEISEDGALLYATDRTTLYRSSDFGQTWTAGAPIGANSNSYVMPFHVDPTNANRVIARMQDGLSITNDAGDHWTALATPPASYVGDIAFNRSGGRIWAATPEGLWHTSDDGAHWTISTLTAAVSKVAIHPTDPSIMYAHDGSSIYRSTDAGATWTSTSGSLSPRTVNALAIDPHARERLLIATLTGVWSSADAGLTWSRHNRGLVGGTPWYLNSTPDRLYFVVRGQIYSLDWGSSAPVGLDAAMMNLVLSSDEDDYLYELHADRLPTGDRLFVSNNGNVARSLDGGRSWASLDDPLMRAGVNALDVAPDNPNIVLASNWNEVVRSIDGGDHWSTTSGIATDDYIDTITFVSADVAYASGGQKLYRSTNAGLSWSPVDLRLEPGEFFSSVLVQGTTTFLGTSLSGYRSSDGGLSWTRLPLSHGGRFAADATGIYLGASRSVDGGNTWTSIGGPAMFFSWTGLQLDPTAPGRLVAATESGGIQTYTVATDLVVTAAGQPTVIPASGARTDIWFTVTNRGPHTAAGVILNINVAGGRALFENADCTVNASAQSQAICRLGSMPSGQSKMVRIQSSFETPDPLSITASVASVETEVAAADNTFSQSWSYSPPTRSSGGGGGGGALSWWMLLALAGIAAERRRVVC